MIKAIQNKSSSISLSTKELLRMKEEFATLGYTVARGLFSAEDVEKTKGHFMKIHREKDRYSKYTNIDLEKMKDNDPLKEYPRVIHPHRWDSLSMHYFLHPGVIQCLKSIFDENPVAVQTMFYYKPPGARGQAMHQDQFYLMVNPGTCCAAWTAIDDADAENGGMFVVPKTNEMEVVCPEKSKTSESFIDHMVPTPKGKKAQLVPLKAGDTLFFNGSTLHGSSPNRSKDRFRRSFISHYCTGNAEKISKFYSPLYDLEGNEINTVASHEQGGPCGEDWTGGQH